MDPTMRFILQCAAGLVATPVVFYGGYPFIKGAFSGLRSLHFSMDLLIVMEIGAAYGLSIHQTFQGGETYYDTAVMIVTLILLGRLLEQGAKTRALDTVNSLSGLAPDKARLTETVNNDTDNVLIPVNHVKKDQNLTVLPGERIPLDGFVTRGHSETDESMLTGESQPVAKSPGLSVLGGTINLNGRLEFRVTHTARETTLSRIIQSVLDAQARKASIQACADRVVSVFVPCVLALATFTFLLTLPGHILRKRL